MLSLVSVWSGFLSADQSGRCVSLRNIGRILVWREELKESRQQFAEKLCFF